MSLLSFLVKIVIGYLFLHRVPQWLHVRGLIALIVRLIGVLIIIYAAWNFLF